MMTVASETSCIITATSSTLETLRVSAVHPSNAPGSVGWCLDKEMEHFNFVMKFLEA